VKLAGSFGTTLGAATLDSLTEGYPKGHHHRKASKAQAVEYPLWFADALRRLIIDNLVAADKIPADSGGALFRRSFGPRGVTVPVEQDLEEQPVPEPTEAPWKMVMHRWGSNHRGRDGPGKDGG
jgi:hypothetical protein